jgi:hypothetical protein
MNADTFALRASLETQAARKKQGSAADRAALAAFARQRTRHTNGLVQGNFTRKQWNAQLSEYIWNNLARMTRARRLHVAKGEK